MAKLPPIELLKEKAQHTDIEKVIIDENAGTVFLEDPEMRLDVGAIAKGYATEQLAHMLEERGISHILLSVGGNVRAIAAGGKAEGMDVGIQIPTLKVMNSI
jgi:thiamine biosynthesis lipoprotein